MTIERSVPTKPYNPYDLNEIAEIDSAIERYRQQMIRKVQGEQEKTPEKPKVKRTLLEPKDGEQK